VLGTFLGFRFKGGVGKGLLYIYAAPPRDFDGGSLRTVLIIIII